MLPLTDVVENPEGNEMVSFLLPAYWHIVPTIVCPEASSSSPASTYNVLKLNSSI